MLSRHSTSLYCFYTNGCLLSSRLRPSRRCPLLSFRCRRSMMFYLSPPPSPLLPTRRDYSFPGRLCLISLMRLCSPYVYCVTTLCYSPPLLLLRPTLSTFCFATSSSMLTAVCSLHGFLTLYLHISPLDSLSSLRANNGLRLTFSPTSFASVSSVIHCFCAASTSPSLLCYDLILLPTRSASPPDSLCVLLRRPTDSANGCLHSALISTFCFAVSILYPCLYPASLHLFCFSASIRLPYLFSYANGCLLLNRIDLPLDVACFRMFGDPMLLYLLLRRLPHYANGRLPLLFSSCAFPYTCPSIYPPTASCLFRCIPTIRVAFSPLFIGVISSPMLTSISCLVDRTPPRLNCSASSLYAALPV